MNALHTSLDGLEDIFSGRGGSQDQGTPSTAGPGDGGKSQTINRWLSVITGAYEAVTGAGTESGPAPAPQASSSTAPSQTPWMLYGGIALAVAALWFLFKGKR
jgi:LPXTG-motif cell wall-anchored protein